MDQRFGIVCILLFVQGVAPASVYGPLIEYVKSKSSPLEIPRPSADEPLLVDLQAGWMKIQNVDYVNNEIEGLFGTVTSWTSGISWAPADYNGKSFVVLDSSLMYKPVFTVINAVGTFENWLDNHLVYYFHGGAVVRTIYRGKIFCNEELQVSNTCRIRFASYGTTSNVVSIMEPAQHKFDYRKLFDRYYFKGSRFNLTTQGYEIHKEFSEEMGLEFVHMDYVFSFEEKENSGGNYHSPTVFEF